MPTSLVEWYEPTRCSSQIALSLIGVGGSCVFKFHRVGPGNAIGIRDFDRGGGTSLHLISSVQDPLISANPLVKRPNGIPLSVVQCVRHGGRPIRIVGPPYIHVIESCRGNGWNPPKPFQRRRGAAGFGIEPVEPCSGKSSPRSDPFNRRTSIVQDDRGLRLRDGGILIRNIDDRIAQFSARTLLHQTIVPASTTRYPYRPFCTVCAVIWPSRLLESP